jgi:hypothetical protein
VNQGPRGYYLMKKTEGRKPRDTVPLTFTKTLIWNTVHRHLYNRDPTLMFIL